MTVYPACARLLPCTVTLADPVPALFPLLITLRLRRPSTDIASVTLPDRDPAVAETRRDASMPWAT